MRINLESQLPHNPVEIEGAENVRMSILVGSRDGSNDIIMRLFTILPGGHTPRHVHDWEHLIKIEKGRGIAVDGNGNEHEVAPGTSLFVPGGEEHQFRNPFSEEFQFICVIPAH
jgi:quercetin dioxygenase-like cupin family protein